MSTSIVSQNQSNLGAQTLRAVSQKGQGWEILCLIDQLVFFVFCLMSSSEHNLHCEYYNDSIHSLSRHSLLYYAANWRIVLSQMHQCLQRNTNIVFVFIISSSQGSCHHLYNRQPITQPHDTLKFIHPFWWSKICNIQYHRLPSMRSGGKAIKDNS